MILKGLGLGIPYAYILGMEQSAHIELLPSKNYIALLDIKAIIRKWQDLDLSDDHALIEIREILERLTK